MNHASHNKLVSFIWSIADDCLRDVYVRGKYRDVILPMVVLRRLDSLLEPSKKKVLDEADFQRKKLKNTELEAYPLTKASGYVFYNTSKWTMKQLHDTATNNQQILLANVEEYLNGFSENVKEIIQKFNLKAQVRHMASKDVLLDVLEKFTSPYINLTRHSHFLAFVIPGAEFSEATRNYLHGRSVCWKCRSNFQPRSKQSPLA